MRYLSGMSALNLRLPDSLRARSKRAPRKADSTVSRRTSKAVLLADSTGGTALENQQLESLLLSRADGPFVDADEADFRQMRGKLQQRLEGGPESKP
jgi:hypothetical protein